MFRFKKRPSYSKESFDIPIENCLAKTIKGNKGSVGGISVTNHCIIAGVVARELISCMPKFFGEPLNRFSADSIVAVHDIGKISPSFQERIYYSIGQRLGLVSGCDVDSAIGGHCVVGKETLRELRMDVSEIIGRHHGYIPIQGDGACAEKYGGRRWHVKRLRAIAYIQRKLGRKIPKGKIPYEYRELLCGLTTVSDWIASGGIFETMSSLPDWNSLGEMVKDAVETAGFVYPQVKKGLSFEEIFGFAPNPLQKSASRVITGPGVYFIEAPMGMGKTEAALYAAYCLLAKGMATGIYFALPTQFTSEQMFNRVRDNFLANILEGERKQLFLLHSLSWLVETEMGEDASVGKSWFSDNKRKILFPYAVGTIDQALLGVLNVRHNAIRIFGLYGKVVILDEIHSYDAYTFVFIKNLIDILSRLGCTVILLSATLTKKAKISLAGMENEEGIIDAYPMVSVVENKNISSVPIESPERKLKVQIKLPFYDEAIDMALDGAYEGSQVVWIENTVAEAQEIYKILAAKCSGELEVGLLHSRFIKPHRLRKEEYWVSLLGKNSGKKRYSKGRILIGTQVLEQSIDIDADIMVSRIAPSDMLLQRIGRLWRHSEYDKYRKRRQPVFVLLTPTEIEDGCFGPSEFIYPSYVLARTLLTWQKLDFLQIPAQLKTVLENTYTNIKEEDSLLIKWKKEWEEKKKKLEAKASIVTSRVPGQVSDNELWTRYSEVDMCRVLLLRKFNPEKGSIVLLDEELKEQEIDISIAKKLPKRQRKEIAKNLMLNIVSVPGYIAPESNDYRELFSGFLCDEGGDLKVCLVGRDNELLNLHFLPVRRDGISFYDDILGYRFVKR